MVRVHSINACRISFKSVLTLSKSGIQRSVRDSLSWMGDGACSWRLEVAEEAQMLLTLSQWLRMPLQPGLLLGNTHRGVCTQTRPVRHIKQGWQVCWSAASLMATPPENSSLRLCECVKCSKHFPITVWVEGTQKCLDHRAEGKRQAGTGETGKIGLYDHSSASLIKDFYGYFSFISLKRLI